MFSVPLAAIDGVLRPSGGLVASYAHRPLVLTTPGDDVTHDLVDHQLVVHAWAGLELERRLHVFVSAPTTLSQGGGSPVVRGPASATVFGDLRLGVRVALPEPGPAWPDVAMGAELWLPTGDAKSYAGSDTVRVAPRLSVGGSAGAFWWASSLASRLAPQARSSFYGSELELGVAGGVVLGPLRVGPEVATRIDLRDERGPAPNTTTAEARLGATLKLGSWAFGLAAGPGISRAPGTPVLRVIAGIALATDLAEAATEPSGGTPSSVDEPSDLARVGPELVASSTRAVREEPQPASTPAELGQASPDATNDTPDVGTPCATPSPDGAVASSDPAPCADPATTGAELSLAPDRIVVLEPIRFLLGAAELDPSGLPLLDRIAALIVAHPELTRIAVDGHTDGRGNPGANLRLSRRRAVAVMNALIARGVDARRLEARGFGRDRPVADDGTAEGRAKNRRVELVVRQRSARGKEGWVDGTVE